MKHLFTTLILILLAGNAMADCIGYSDSFDIRVLDAKIRPIEGAMVQVKYDRGASFGDQYFTTEPLATDENGTVHISIHNQGTVNRKIDCEIFMNATTGGAYGEKTIEAGIHGPIVDINVNAYRTEIEVNDQQGNPLENATVTIGGLSKKTNEYGKVVFYLAAGEVGYLVSYYKGKESGAIPVSDDTHYEVILLKYSISIDAVDDQGNPVDATLTIFDETFVMENGHYEEDNIYGNVVVANLSYMSIKKEITILPAEENEVVVAFDVNAPVIENINTSTIGMRPRMTMKIVDKGEYASGVDEGSIIVSYKILPSAGLDQWTTATTFVSAENTYITDFPEIEFGKIIEFRIEARDNEGNKVVQTGKFVTVEEEEDVEIPIEEPEISQELPLFYIGIGVILIIVVVYIVKHIMSQGKNEV